MDVFILMASIITVSITLFVTRGALSYKRTILGYFWGDKTIDPKIGAHLLWSGSLSLNGLFYHTWLGYQVGLYSLVIQLIWVAGFFLMILFLTKGKLHEFVSEDTLHGNIRTNYGRNVQILAAIASIITFITLSAWELSVFEGFVTSEISIDSEFIWLIPAIALFVTFLYTVRGGLLYNSKVNAVFGKLSFAVLGIATILVIVETGPLYFFSRSVIKWDWAFIGITIGWLGFFANGLFSVLWQISDMSTWQNLTSVSSHKNGIKKALMSSAIKILIAPGLVGTIFGMSLVHSEGVTDTNILSKIMDVFTALPAIPSAFLTILILVVFFAATLSTLDGQLLASTKALIFDVLHLKKARDYLFEDTITDSNDEATFRVSDVLMTLIALVIGIVTYAFHTGALSLFDMVYIAVIGQLSLVPATIFMLLGKQANYQGLVGISAGLIGGSGAVLLNVFNVETLMEIDSWLYIAPIATIVFSMVGIRKAK